METNEEKLLAHINEKVFEAQQENRALRYSVLTETTLPTIREHLLMAGISCEDLVRYDSFVAEMVDICKKYLNTK